MPSLDSYIQDGDETQKQTHVTFNNPDHEDYKAREGEDIEQIRRRFNAANSIQSSSIDRTAIVGDFLIALEEEHMRGEEGAVEEFLREIQG